MEATAPCHEEHHEGGNMSEAIRTVLISLATAGIIWLVYTTVESKSQIKLLDYKVSQVQKSLDEIKVLIKGK